MGLKIGIIGAGSGIFSLNLIKDMCLCRNLDGAHVCFMDINEQRLNAVYRLCERYAGEVGINFTIEKTLDRKKCLEGADFVVNTALPGGYDELLRGWNIAKKWGYNFGGSLHVIHDESFFMNFHQLQLMDSIARDVLEICPKAWLVMVSNPVMAGITYLTRKYKDLKVVGMCHGFANVFGLADRIGIPRDEIEFQIPGVNHFVWLTEFKYKGEDAYKYIDEWIESGKIEEYWKDLKLSGQFNKKAVDLYRKFGVFPIGDTGNPGGGSWGHFYHTDREVEERYHEDPNWWYDDYFMRSRTQAEKLARVAADDTVKVTEAYPTKKSAEPMVPLIEALGCGVRREVVVNIQNSGGFVEGVPLDFECEISAVLDGDGIHGRKMKPLPKALQAWMLRDRIAPVNLELEAFDAGDKELLIQLILMDPWTKTRKQAEGMLEEILEMPFNADMKKYYK